MKYKRLHNLPVWSIENWDLPDLELTPLQPHGQGDETVDHLRVEMEGITDDWKAQWNKYTDELSRHLREDTEHDSTVDSMWKHHIKDFQINHGGNPFILNDKPGYQMAHHIDNRAIVGVIIINLKDNSDSTEFADFDWKGPTNKGTGLFMLNNGDLHKIEVTGDRLIAYQPLTLDTMFNINT